MTEKHHQIDRRTLFRLLGAAGASMSVATACGTSAEGLPEPAGAAFNKTVTLASAGPGGNKAWKPGEPAKFVPPESMPTSGKASDLLARQPKEKLHSLYELMSRSRQWERTMKDLFVSGAAVPEP